jgi:lactaldehyde dehydrogenase/glycolaldehyde dehydrogenase
MKDLKMFINGKFVDNASGKWIDVLNPSTEEVIARQPDGTADDANAAVDAAEKAQKSWEKVPAVERGKYLHRIADGIRKREKELTDIIVCEGGKTQGLANVEVNFTADYIDYMAEWARRYEGEIIQSDRPGETIMLFKRPIGVAAGILPWNFPFFLIARKAAPALVTGNTIVLKPSQLTPINAFVFAEIVKEVGLPAGVFNIVNGRGSVVGSALASNPESRIGKSDRQRLRRPADYAFRSSQYHQGIAGTRWQSSRHRSARRRFGPRSEVDYRLSCGQYRPGMQQC